MKINYNLLFGNANTDKRKDIAKELNKINNISSKEGERNQFFIENINISIVYEEFYYFLAKIPLIKNNSKFLNKNLIFKENNLNNQLIELILINASAKLIANLESSSTAAEFIMSRTAYNDYRSIDDNIYIVPFNKAKFYELYNEKSSSFDVYDKKLKDNVGFVSLSHIYNETEKHNLFWLINNKKNPKEKYNLYSNDNIFKNIDFMPKQWVWNNLIKFLRYTTNKNKHNRHFSKLDLINDNLKIEILNEDIYKQICDSIKFVYPGIDISRNELELIYELLIIFILRKYSKIYSVTNNKIQSAIYKGEEQWDSIDKIKKSLENIYKYIIKIKDSSKSRKTDKSENQFKKIIIKSKTKSRVVYSLIGEKYPFQEMWDEIKESEEYNLFSNKTSFAYYKKIDNLNNSHGPFKMVEKIFNNAHRFYLKLDIENFFNEINHKILIKNFNWFTNNKYENKIAKYIEIIENVNYKFNEKMDRGILPGTMPSTILSNLYFNLIDSIFSKKDINYLLKNNDNSSKLNNSISFIRENLYKITYYRYSDDLLISTNYSEDLLIEIYDRVKFLIKNLLDLKINTKKVKIIDLKKEKYFKILGIVLNYKNKELYLTLPRKYRNKLAKIKKEINAINGFLDEESLKLIQIQNGMNSYQTQFSDLEKKCSKKSIIFSPNDIGIHIFNRKNMRKLFFSHSINEDSIHLTAKTNFSEEDYRFEFKRKYRENLFNFKMSIWVNKNGNFIYLSDKDIIRNLSNIRQENKFESEISFFNPINNPLSENEGKAFKYKRYLVSDGCQSSLDLLNIIINYKKEDEIENFIEKVIEVSKEYENTGNFRDEDFNNGNNLKYY